MASPPAHDGAGHPLHHPLPDLQSGQGAYVGNISRLEEHAERMSEAGSDLNEEIRKLHTELKASDSRRSSLRSLGFPGDELARVQTGRSRNLSTSSHANSVVDTNGPARWGGYSPAGYVTSPAGSLGSGSWSNPPASLQRHRSGSKASRLAHVSHAEHAEHAPDDYPRSPGSVQATPVEYRPPPQRHVSSFTRQYEAIANEIRDEIRHNAGPARTPSARPYQQKQQQQQQNYAQQHHDSQQDNDGQQHHDGLQHNEGPQHSYTQHGHDYTQHANDDYNHDHDHDPRDLPDRPPTAASTDTTQAPYLWQDFDGTHAPDTVPEEDEPQPAHGRHRSSSSLMPRGADLPHGVPPPDEDMVFYPAPVPRMLNLPKRLSQLPASDVAARRRTQVLDQIEAENRKSAPWLTSPDPPKNRKSRQSVAGLPAALRASAFFDQQGPAQEFEVKGESAEDTLDSILEASARAPVSAFTDHTFGGGYSPEHKRKSTKMSLMDPVIVEPTKRRSSFNILDTDTNSSGKKLNKLKKRNSSADMNILIARAAESRMSLGADLDDPDQHARGPNDPDARGPNDPDTASRHSSDDDRKSDDEREKDAEFEEELLDDEEPQYFGPPTTLLAELQLRKAKQKERNMNYVTMVEEGKITSHRTLLDLNDDAEKEHQRRLKKKVQLAWEAQEDDSDDDVPLGVLYKQPQRREIDYPIGLIAQRELEDHEPLSRRRERITGIPNSRRAPAPGPYDSQTTLEVPRVATPLESEEEEHTGETLGERMRRLKDKQMLEAALGDDVRKSTVSGDFAAEMLSKLGVDESTKDPKDPKDPPAAPEDPDEETLGQRRARLKAEAEARGDPPPTTIPPPLRSKMSLADVLAANPHDASNQARKVSDQQLLAHLPPGSLLRQNALAEEKRRVARLNQNMRSSSYNVPADPLVRGVGDAKPSDDEDIPLAHKIQAYKDKMAGVGGEPHARAQSMLFHPGMNVSQSSMMTPGGMPGMQPTMLQSQIHPGLGPRQSSMPMQMSMMQQGPQMNVVGGMPMMGMQGVNGGMGQGVNMQGMPMQNMGMNMGMSQGMGMSPGMNMQNLNMGQSMGMGMNMNMNMQRGMPGQPMPMQMPMGMPMGMGVDMLPMNGQQRSNIEGWMRGIR